MKLTKANLITYKNLLMGSYPKSEIIKYMFRRLFGVYTSFSRDVYVRSRGIILNCGRIMDNCKGAVDNFEPEIEKEIRGDRGVFVDVGSSIGKFSIYAAEKGFRVISIDADSETIKLLKESLLMNGVSEKVIVKDIACFDKKGEACFYINKRLRGTSSIINKTSEGIMKKIDTLDNILRGIEDIKIIKIDVECAELQVLKGARKIIIKHKPKIIFEAWNIDYFKPVEEYLLSLGYKINKIGNYNYVATIK